jgi:RNA polymerase sigma-70 factor (ECF subfamily)
VANGASEAAGAASSDEELIRRAGAGDRAAFAALVARHGDALFRFVRRGCGSAADAEDALQDGLVAAWRGARTFRGDARARTWLFQVVLHAARRRARRRAGEPSAHEPLDAAAAVESDAPGPEARTVARETGAALERALAALPAEAAEVLLLRDVTGLSGEETAEVLGIAVPAMKSRLHRARLELKERVEALLGHPVEEGVP